MRKMAFIIPPFVEILDLAGPAQVFTEAKFNGFELSLEYYSFKDEVMSTCGLPFNNVKNYREADLREAILFLCPVWMISM